MKLIVDKMPTTANECMFSAMGTGKPRCRHDARLCPIQRGEECPHLVVVETAEPVEPKKRPAKRSTAKKAD